MLLRSEVETHPSPVQPSVPDDVLLLPLPYSSDCLWTFVTVMGTISTYFLDGV